MLELFNNTPTWDTLDYSQITWEAIEKGERVLYKNREWTVKMNLHLDETGRLQSPDHPLALTERLQEIGARFALYPPSFNFNGSVPVFDRHGEVLVERGKRTLIEKMMDVYSCEGIVSLGVDDDFSDDGSSYGDHRSRPPLSFFVDAVRLTDYTSPSRQMRERIEYIEHILNMPNNLGSVQGWVELMKANWDSH